MTPVFGEFLEPAREHISAAVSYRGELPYTAQCGVVRQLDRLAAALVRYLSDLPDEPRSASEVERGAMSRIATARLALGRAAQILAHTAAGLADADAGETHPVVGHLSAAADYLTVGRDLLQTHFTQHPSGMRTGNSYWAPVITSGPVTAALLAELADHAHNLASWTAQQSRRSRVSPGAPTSVQLALRSAEPGLRLAGTAIQAAQPGGHLLAARSLLDAIPVNAPPPRQPPGTGESVQELCERIPVTAERLRYAAFTFATRAHWSPAAASVSWRRDALGSAITCHCAEFILHTLAERADQLNLNSAVRAQLHTAANRATPAWTSWRAVAGHWDILTTGTTRSTGLTPAAAEITDLAVRTGRLAYHNPHWTPTHHDASPIRDPAALAHSQGNVITALTAVHHAVDAVGRIAVSDHQAVVEAATGNRLYVPTRLLSDKYDIPHPYTCASRAHTEALLAAYHTAIEATTTITAALDDLTRALNAPSRLLAATRQASAAGCQQQRHRPLPRQIPQPQVITPPPGRTEQALHKLQIRDPALLLRAAIIDQAARELIAEATANTHNRDVAAGHVGRPTRVAGQDTPRMPRAAQPAKDPGRPGYLRLGPAVVVKPTSKRTCRSRSATRHPTP